MRTITVNNFSEGIQPSRFSHTIGGFAISKHFDTTSYPNRLMPYRGMTADTTGQTNVGNLIILRDGSIVGIGTDGSGNGKLYRKASMTDGWAAISNGTGGGSVEYNFCVEYKVSAARRIFFATGGNKIYIADPSGASSINDHDLSYANIAQGVVHPNDDILYIPYDNKIASYNDGTTTWTDVALTLPNFFRITCIVPYGNYLAIFCATSLSGTDVPNKSMCFLWNRDDTLVEVSEAIDWGTGVVRVANYVDGILMALTDLSGASATILDRDMVQIKGYGGGAPYVIDELSTDKQTTTAPDAVINGRVNFIYRGKWYFSLNLQGGSTSPSYYGLFSLSKSKVTGRYVTNLERVATNDNSETGVLAAVIQGDYALMVHTAVGTVTRSISSSTIATAFAATSVLESLVNPQMPNKDYSLLKKLRSFSIYTSPLTSAGQIVVKYRVDGGSWVTIFTKTSTLPDTDVAAYTQRRTASGQFTDGRNFEFRIESTGGAEIIGYAYQYIPMAQ